jgi:hypothetical protein
MTNDLIPRFLGRLDSSLKSHDLLLQDSRVNSIGASQNQEQNSINSQQRSIEIRHNLSL